MLVKLLKYDLKACLRIFPIIAIGVAASFTLGMLANVFNITQVSGTSVIVLAVLAVASICASMVIVILRFCKGLYGSQGYLYQTLPVKAGNLLASKIINAYICTLVSVLLSMVSVFAIFIITGIETDVVTQLVNLVVGNSAVPFVIYIAVSSAILLLVFFASAFFAVTAAHTRPFIRNNIVMAILIYFVINFAKGFLEIAFMLIIPLGIELRDGGFVWSTGFMVGMLSNNDLMSNLQEGSGIVNGMILSIGNWIADIAVAVILFIAARRMMIRKISIK